MQFRSVSPRQCWTAVGSGGEKTRVQSGSLSARPCGGFHRTAQYALCTVITVGLRAGNVVSREPAYPPLGHIIGPWYCTTIGVLQILTTYCKTAFRVDCSVNFGSEAPVGKDARVSSTPVSINRRRNRIINHGSSS